MSGLALLFAAGVQFLGLARFGGIAMGRNLAVELNQERGAAIPSRGSAGRWMAVSPLDTALRRCPVPCNTHQMIQGRDDAAERLWH
jgi:hypothetical protein